MSLVVSGAASPAGAAASAPVWPDRAVGIGAGWPERGVKPSQDGTAAWRRPQMNDVAQVRPRLGKLRSQRPQVRILPGAPNHSTIKTYKTTANWVTKWPGANVQRLRGHCELRIRLIPL